ncbi:MAG: DNA repair protein RadA [Thermodesulfobacteriota bacterium]
MAKARSVYNCQSCGHSSHKWLGRCPECNSWNTFVEERVFQDGKRRGLAAVGSGAVPSPISSLSSAEEDRLSTGVGELDRVLGGGMVLGSATLIGGDPGIGKSTLLLQAMAGVVAGGRKVLYVSGEESPRQIRLRAGRLGISSENLLVWSETGVERVMETVKATAPAVVVIDSVQTLFTEALESSPGSVSQVREVSFRLIATCKALDIPLFLVGHVTKDGSIAGPRVLEHMVDTVLYFEGDASHVYRVLRAVKNRYGSVMEIGVFEMCEEGLREVLNPSEVFLAERPVGASGSCVVSSLEGTRTILVEVQALVSPALFGVPRRTVVGVDYNRVLLLAAVLEKKAGITLANHDIFLKVAGGIRLDEPSIDLGVVVSLTSNFLDKAVDQRAVVFGEVGLAGEVRAIMHVLPRIKEAEKLGFTKCVLPRGNLKGLGKAGTMELIGVSTVKEAIDALFE